VTFVVIKIHGKHDGMNCFVVSADFLKQRNRNNAVIENARIKSALFRLPLVLVDQMQP
jgi:oligoribonuclease NrnB/cAMP/cGMP phosphodiesterase (DHH superfamily)